MTEQTEHCCEEGCTKPIFQKKLRLCSGHYQRRRRKKEVEGPIRSYGAGRKRVSGCVDEERFAKLKAEADKSHGGSIYSLIQDAMSVYADGLE